MEENKENNVNKTIWKTAGITASVLLVLSILVIGGLSLFAPVTIASWAKERHFYALAVYYYETTYQKSNDINDLYRLLDASILLGNNEKIVSNFELLYENDGETYEDFIAYMNAFYVNTENDINLNLYLSNEDRRLKRHYITALYGLNQKEKAYEFAIADLENETFLSIDNYQNLNFIMLSYLGQLMQEDVIASDYEIFKHYTGGNYNNYNFLQTAYTYYEAIKNIYDTSFYLAENTKENNYELYMIANHLAVVAGALLHIDTMLDDAIDTSTFTSEISDYFTQMDVLLERYLEVE